MFKQYKLKDYKFRLILWLLAISSLGVMIVGSAQRDLQDKQLYGVLFSIVVMIIVSLIDYTWILNFYWLIYVVNLLLLLGVIFLGDDAGGATRWIDIGFIRFQPSELSKILLILFFAKFFSNHEEDLSKLKTIIKAIILIGPPLVLIEMQPDLSTTIVVALIFCALYYIAGLSYKIIGGIILVCIPVVTIFFSIIMQPDQTILNTYQLNRIMAWLQPSQYTDTASQQLNSIIAIGSGQLSGKGLDTSIVSSVKNGNFISQVQTDFIFAVVGEELGFIGCCAIIVLLLLIAMECIWIGRRARDMAGTLICTGMASLVLFQGFVNICVATGLMPNTGLPLPFVSYGLTSVVSCYLGMGLVLNVGLQSQKKF